MNKIKENIKMYNAMMEADDCAEFEDFDFDPYID